MKSIIKCGPWRVSETWYIDRSLRDTRRFQYLQTEVMKELKVQLEVSLWIHLYILCY